METINARFKELRIECQKSQEQWGALLGLTKSGVSDIERGRRNVTDQHLIMLSNWKEKRINIDWLKTGEGKKFKELPEMDEVASYTEDLLDHKEEENPFYDIIIGMMKTYHELDEPSKKAALELFRKLRKNLEQKKEG